MNNIFERPILFYSEYCIHSTNFITILMKTPELFETFIRINIDVDLNTKQRPKIFYDIQNNLQIKISEVPTIITPGPEYILTGAEAFNWLENEIQQYKSASILGFNSIEMGSFSDSYSNYGSSDLHDAKEQCFKFIGKPDDKIETPQEDSSVSKDDYTKKYQERENFQNTFNQNMSQNQNPSNMNRNTKNQNMMLNNMNSTNNRNTNNRNTNNQNMFNNFSKHSNVSEKQKDLDNRLQQMIAERENFGQGIQRR